MMMMMMTITVAADPADATGHPGQHGCRGRCHVHHRGQGVVQQVKDRQEVCQISGKSHEHRH